MHMTSPQLCNTRTMHKIVGYYGISMISATDSGAGGGDIYTSFILASMVEIPAYLLSPWLMDHWGRRPMMSVSLILSGTCCIAAGFVNKNPTAKTALASIGTK